jgi:hypothetical protein
VRRDNGTWIALGVAAIAAGAAASSGGSRNQGATQRPATWAEVVTSMMESSRRHAGGPRDARNAIPRDAHELSWTLERVDPRSVPVEPWSSMDVKRYARRMAKGSEAPPVVLIERPGRIQVVDGAHRIQAAVQAEVPSISAWVGRAPARGSRMMAQRSDDPRPAHGMLDAGVCGDGDLELFHVTTMEALQSIQQHGLRGRAVGQQSVYANMQQHSRGRVFFAVGDDALNNWYNAQAEMPRFLNSRWRPVILRVVPDYAESELYYDLSEDEHGADDIHQCSVFTSGTIPPDQLEVALAPVSHLTKYNTLELARAPLGRLERLPEVSLRRLRETYPANLWPDG